MPDLFKIGLSVTFQSSFFKGLVSLYSSEVSLLFCSVFYAAEANNAQLSYVATAQPLARAPYVILFDLKPLIEDGNLQVYICTVCMHEKESQEPPEHTLQHVKFQNFLGACPQTPPLT